MFFHGSYLVFLDLFRFTIRQIDERRHQDKRLYLIYKLSGIRVVIVYSYTAAPEVYDLSASRMGTPTQVKENSIGESLIGST